MSINVIFVLNVIIASTIIYYLKKLEEIDCRCALNFKHNYILYFTSIALFFGIVNALFGERKLLITTMTYIYIPFLIASIINIIYTIQYINDVKENKCECSESVFREGMYILAIIRLCVIVLLFILFFSLIFQDPTSFKKMVSNKAFWNKVINKSKK